MKIRNCIVCHEESLKDSHKVEFLKKSYYYDTCSNCGFTFQNPWPNREVEKIYIDSKYWNSTQVYNEKKQSLEKSNNSYAAYQNSRASESTKRYNKLKRYFSSPGSVLEIACANGIFLTDWERNGWKCLGVDPAKEMIDFGIQNYGLNLKCKKWEEIEIEKESLECIFMWGADSNFYEFNKGFQKIYNSLKKNGIFAMSYQNFQHPIRKIFKQIKLQHHNLYLFSKKSIHLHMKNIGFQVIDHSLTWQNTKLSHIKKILGMNTKGMDFNLTIPALSYNMIILKKI
jgi:SAM-dependent methyltransferase